MEMLRSRSAAGLINQKENGKVVFRKFIALVLGLGALAGCHTAPKDIGQGRFEHLYSPSGNLLRQGNHKTATDCEARVRALWGGYAGYGLSATCSSADESGMLPYYVDVLESDDPSEASQFRFALQPSCQEMAQLVMNSPGSKSGSTQISAHCESTAKVEQSSGVRSKWVKVGEAKQLRDQIESVARFYVDPATVHGSGNIRSAMTLISMRVGKDAAFRSIKTFFEIDCVENRRRPLSLTTIDGPMGEGQVIELSTEQAAEMKKIVGVWDTPGREDAAVLKYVCAQ